MPSPRSFFGIWNVREWPPQARRLLYEVSIGDTKLQLFGHPVLGGYGGYFELKAIVADAVVCSRNSNGFAIRGPRTFFVLVTWDGEQTVEMFLDNMNITIIDDPVPIVRHYLAEGPAQPGGPLSFDDPDVRDACKDWTLWRERRFGNQTTRQASGDRQKSFPELLDEMESALGALRDLAELVASGKRHMLQPLSGSLRALVYWSGSTYDPLLLRLAWRLGLPLPIYAFPPIKQDLPPIDGIEQALSSGTPSLVRFAPAHQLMDLQRWLNNSYTRWIPDGGQPSEFRGRTVQEIIGDFANQMGGSHHDPSTPPVIDVLKSHRSDTSDFLTAMFLDAAQIIWQMGTYVLGKGREQQSAPDSATDIAGSDDQPAS